MKILLVDKGETFKEFASSLSGKADVVSCQSGQEAIELTAKNQFAVVCVGEELADGSGMEFVHHFAKTHPLTNCALLSAMESEDFHEATEGLGLVMQIAPKPGKSEAERLITILESINSLF